MVIYAFLLGFSSPSRQKEWFKIWKIRDQPNHTNHIKEPQISYSLVVLEDSHLSYKRYKVKNYVSKAIQGTQGPVHTDTLFLYLSIYFLFFIFLSKKLKTKHKETNN